MNKSTILFLKAIRKFYIKTYGSKNTFVKLKQDPDTASKIISEEINSSKPSMIARFGSTELNCVLNYLGVKSNQKNYISYIKGEALPWWWEPNRIKQMNQSSGFFPTDIMMIEKFCELMLQDIPEVDVLGSWLEGETFFKKELAKSKKVRFSLLNPFWSSVPWTWSLKGKKVLVVHPFAKTIEQQYEKRSLLFKNNLLPEFNLKTIKAVQGYAGAKTEFKNWFEALDYMKDEIEKVDFDICLIACGAYGFPLAAHIKRMGKKGFHMGGSLQLLFGIRGRRWDDPNYNNEFNFAELVNEHWVRPLQEDMPERALKVERGSYW